MARRRGFASPGSAARCADAGAETDAGLSGSFARAKGTPAPAAEFSTHARPGGIRMKRVSLFAMPLFSALLALSSAPASAGVPELNVRAICKTRDAGARLFHSTTGQSVDECVHDEEAAKQQLTLLWTTVVVPIRNRCESEARALGTMSYLDLVTCIQMADELKDDLKPTSKKAARE